MSSLQNKQRLPEGWHLARFDELLKRIERKIILDDAAFYDCVGVRWYGLGAFVRERLLGMDIARKQQWIIKAGDILYNKLFAWKGAFAIADNSVDGCIVSDKFPTYEADSAVIDPQFLRYYFRTTGLAQQAQDISKGAAAISKLTLNPPQFWDLTIPLPPLEEQHRIVARIEELAARIEKARGLKREAVEGTEKVISRVISNLRFDERYWTTIGAAVLDKKGSIRSGPFGSQLHHDEFVNSGVAAIGTRDVQVQHFTISSGWFVTHQKFEQFRRYQVFPGDVLVTIVGGSIGRFCVVPANVPLAFTTKHVIALTLNPSKAIPEFISYLLNFHTRCRTSLFSQSEGSAQPSLNSTKILRTEIPLPSLVEQRRIINYIDDIYAKVKVLQHLQSEISAELDALLPSILDKAFKGELSIRTSG